MEGGGYQSPRQPAGPEPAAEPPTEGVPAPEGSASSTPAGRELAERVAEASREQADEDAAFLSAVRRSPKGGARPPAPPIPEHAAGPAPARAQAGPAGGAGPELVLPKGPPVAVKGSSAAPAAAVGPKAKMGPAKAPPPGIGPPPTLVAPATAEELAARAGSTGDYSYRPPVGRPLDTDALVLDTILMNMAEEEGQANTDVRTISVKWWSGESEDPPDADPQGDFPELPRAPATRGG